MSQLVRHLITDRFTRTTNPDRGALYDAIAVLESVRNDATADTMDEPA